MPRRSSARRCRLPRLDNSADTFFLVDPNGTIDQWEC